MPISYLSDRDTYLKYVKSNSTKNLNNPGFMLCKVFFYTYFHSSLPNQVVIKHKMQKEFPLATWAQIEREGGKCT